MREEKRVIEGVLTVVWCGEAGLCSALVAATLGEYVRI